MSAHPEIDAVLAGEKRWCVEHGDSLEVLKALPDNSVDALVCDPPAGINFMGRDFDSDRGGRDKWTAWLAAILREAHRVLKPGAHALIWALPKTSSWTARACEDAGFEIRHVYHHAHGVGFPKAVSADKAIDAHLGAERPVVGTRTFTGTAALTIEEKGGTYSSGIASNGASREVEVTAPATEEAKRWEGWASALKPAMEHWLLCRKNLDGTLAENVLEHGTGFLNVEASRVAAAARPLRVIDGSGKNDDQATSIDLGSGRAVGLTDQGRWPADFLLSHTDRCEKTGTRRVDVGDKPRGATGTRPSGFGNVGAESGSRLPNGPIHADADGKETVGVYACSEDCPVLLLDRQSGERGTSAPGSVTRRQTWSGYHGGDGVTGAAELAYGDTGSASRFFTNLTPDPLDAMPPFQYVNKPSRSEREMGCENLPLHTAGEATGGREEGSAGLSSPRAGAGRTALRGVRNNHPTAKSIALMKNLVTLITPPGGVVLDCFAGSGTTGMAATMLGFRFIGTELNNSKAEPYVDIARARISYVAGGTFKPEARAAGTPAEEAPAAAPRKTGQRSFGW